ncbi:ABC transporter ATP-binding protein [Halococcus sediminicola]|uniref:ABC transporter ATP-binding protein n=1 Tax=Halococcus sediminicola TaxID=1264579 RepID=UPI000679CCDB|nr:ABC transporter ATP-binding protein [Halococcus sediminicola]
MSETTTETADLDSSANKESGGGPNEGILVVNQLTKQFGGLTAVDNLSFTVQENEIVGFIGPNGAGKSTTFNCISGAHKPTAGTVYYAGEDVTDKSTHNMVKRGMARTFQEFRPFYDRSVIENIKLALIADKIRPTGLLGRTTDRASDICERIGLADVEDLQPDELPHASLLRLELGRALATDPSLLLIDEPFAGLARTEVEEIADLLHELRDEGRTLVVVDHNMRGLLDLIDRAIVIQWGSLLAKGTPEEIKGDPQVQNAYLGSETV